MGIISLNLDTEKRPHRRRQTDEYWSRQSIISNGSDTCVSSNVNSFDVVTGVVSATTSPTPKLEWEKYIKREMDRVISVYISRTFC